MPDILVDTRDMAISLDHVSSRVDQTALAVLSMQQEVCEIEKQSAEEICANVNRGFLALLHSQISQKKVMAMSQVEARLVSLRQSVQGLVRIKEQMTRDFQRITSRYTRLFQNINDELRTRIYAIDQPVSLIADKECDSLTRRITNNGGPVPVVHEELLRSQILLTISQCKKNCIRLIDCAAKLIDYNIELQTVISSISKDENIDRIKTKYMPVLLISSTDLNLDNTEASNIVIGNETYQVRNENEIKNTYFESKDQLSWTEESASQKQMISELIRQKISRMNNFDARTKDIMLKLLNKSSWQTLGDVK